MTYEQALQEIQELPSKAPNGQDLIHFIVPSDSLQKSIAKDYILNKFPHVDKNEVRKMSADGDFDIETLKGDAGFFGYVAE